MRETNSLTQQKYVVAKEREGTFFESGYLRIFRYTVTFQAAAYTGSGYTGMDMLVPATYVPA